MEREPEINDKKTDICALQRSNTCLAHSVMTLAHQHKGFTPQLTQITNVLNKAKTTGCFFFNVGCLAGCVRVKLGSWETRQAFVSGRDTGPMCFIEHAAPPPTHPRPSQ